MRLAASWVVLVSITQAIIIIRKLNNPFLGADTSISILIKFIESISKHFSLFFCDALNDGLKRKVYYMEVLKLNFRKCTNPRYNLHTQPLYSLYYFSSFYDIIWIKFSFKINIFLAYFALFRGDCLHCTPVNIVKWDMNGVLICFCHFKININIIISGTFVELCFRSETDQPTADIGFPDKRGIQTSILLQGDTRQISLNRKLFFSFPSFQDFTINKISNTNKLGKIYN